MKRTIQVLVLVLALLVAGALSLFAYRSFSDTQSGFGTVVPASSTDGTATTSGGSPLGELFQGQTHSSLREATDAWDAVSPLLSIAPANGRWIVDAVQFISPSVVLVNFEDGHDAHVAVVDIAGKKLLKLYPSQSRFSKAKWDAVVAAFGISEFVPQTYARSVVRGGEIITFDEPTLVSENVFVGK